MERVHHRNSVGRGIRSDRRWCIGRDHQPYRTDCYRSGGECDQVRDQCGYSACDPDGGRCLAEQGHCRGSCCATADHECCVEPEAAHHRDRLLVRGPTTAPSHPGSPVPLLAIFFPETTLRQHAVPMSITVRNGRFISRALDTKGNEGTPEVYERDGRGARGSVGIQERGKWFGIHNRSGPEEPASMVAHLLMSAPRSRTRLIHDLQAWGAVDGNASVSRNGSAVWEVRGLAVTFAVVRSPGGAVGWRLAVDDKELGPMLAKFGRFAVGVHPVRGDRFEWPGADNSLDLLGSEIRSGTERIQDRDGLCRALMAEADVSDGETFVWLPRASYPSRLVKSFILARSLDDPVLAGMAREKVHALPVSRDNAGRVESGRDVAARYAKSYSKELGFRVDLT